MPPTPPTPFADPPQTIRIDAAAIADAARGVITPGSILLQTHPHPGSGPNGVRAAVLAAGPPAEIDRADLPRPTRTLDLSDRLILPALVNAHTHLDLSHIGPVPHDPRHGFVAWVDHIRANRRDTPEGVENAVRSGIALCVAGGTAAVGDIAGAPAGRLTDAPARALARSPLAGVSFLEFFGIGRSAAASVDRLARFARDDLPKLRHDLGNTPVRMGLQPHAPNTVDLGVYRWASRLASVHDLPLTTHLGETPEEREFIAFGAGPQRAMLERLGVWDDSVLDHLAKGRHPVEHLATVLSESTVLCAHVNDATDGAITLLAATRTPVVYCPRASAYFGAAAHFGAHRYRDMLAAGVTVCLGTDSIVNLDTPDRISVLDEMRLLHRRDGVDARSLLAMATVHGAAALGLASGPVTLNPGPSAGLLAVPAPRGSRDPWSDAMRSSAPPEVLFLCRESFQSR